MDRFYGTDEHGSHIDETTSRHSFKRPCVIISQPKQLKETGNNKVIILPFTSIKGQKERPYHVKILASNYPKILKLKGLDKDSYVLTNEFRTIDVKRLISKISDKLNDSDILLIQEKIKEYIEI